MSERNKTLIRRGVDEIWNKGHFAAADEMVTSDFVVHTAGKGGEIRGSEGIKQYFSALRAAFPDRRLPLRITSPKGTASSPAGALAGRTEAISKAFRQPANRSNYPASTSTGSRTARSRNVG